MGSLAPYAKSITSLVMSALTIGGNLVSSKYGIDPTVVTGVLSVLSSFLVYLVPNKPVAGTGTGTGTGIPVAPVAPVSATSHRSF